MQLEDIVLHIIVKTINDKDNKELSFFFQIPNRPIYR